MANTDLQLQIARFVATSTRSCNSAIFGNADCPKMLKMAATHSFQRTDELTRLFPARTGQTALAPVLKMTGSGLSPPADS